MATVKPLAQRIRPRAIWGTLLRLLVVSLLATACGGGGGGSSSGGGGSGPIIGSLYPATVVRGQDATTVSVLGTNFAPGAVVNLDGVAVPTRYFSSTKLRIYLQGFTIPASATGALTVTNPAATPGGTSTTSAAFTLTLAPADYTVTNISTAATAMVWNPVGGVFYLLVTATNSPNSNSIGILDPATQALTYVPVPSGTPDSMAISSDSQYLYLYSNRDTTIQRLTLPGLTPDVMITAPGTIHDVEPSPDTSRTIAVSIDHDLSPNANVAVLIYDDAVQRPNAVPWFLGLQVFTPDLSWGADGTQLFGRDSSSTSFDLYYFTVDANGVYATRTHDNPTSVGGIGILYDRTTRLLYLGNGLGDTQLIDPAADQWAGTLDSPGLTVADAGTNKAFQLFYTQGPSALAPQATITAFDLTTHNLIEAISFPMNSAGIGPRLIRYGSNGLAFLDNGVQLVTGAFVDQRPRAATGGPDSPAVSTVDGQRVVVVDAQAIDITANPVDGHLFVSRNGYDRDQPNTIAEIDPQTGAILSSRSIATDPGPLTVSGDGQFLYVGTQGTGAVDRFTLPGLASSYHYVLGWNDALGLGFGYAVFLPMELQVAPGQPHTVAVQMASVDPISPTQRGGIRILDDATPRPNVINNFPSGVSRDSIQWDSTATKLFAVDNESTGFAFLWMSVDASGVQPVGGAGNAIATFYADIHYDGVTNRVYSDDGYIIDPATGARDGSFAAAGGTATVDGAINKAFYLSSGTNGGVKITSYDLHSYALIATLELPNVAAFPTRLVRWGGNGLAFNGADGEVWIISGSFVN